MSDDEARAIEDAIGTVDDQDAFARVRARLGWPAGKSIAPAELPRWMNIVAELASRRGAAQLADIATQAVRDPDSPDRLYDLGYALIDAGAPAIAATILWRCLALVGESEDVVCELVSALESALAYDDALAILVQHPTLRQHSFLCRYLYAFNAAMTGRLEITREVLPQLDPSSPETEHMANTIAGIVARADQVAGTCSLDARDLRGWHYVLTGGILLHESPYGFDEPMHGRYAWLADSLARVATGLARLAQLVRPLGLPCVYGAPGRNSEILAHAAAAVLAIPVAPWPAIGVPAPGLVVVYDLGELQPEQLGRLAERKPEQILFAHASPWTSDSPIAPDVTMLLAQTVVPPWGEAVVVDPETRQVSTTPADDRAPEAIAAEIVASSGLDESERVADEQRGSAALVARVWPLSPGTRSRLWAGGPVTSSRFG